MFSVDHRKQRGGESKHMTYIHTYIFVLDQILSSQNLVIIILSRDTLERVKTVSSSERFPSPHLMLTDGEHIGLVTPSRGDDTLRDENL